MHRVVYLIVEAGTEKDAVETAEALFEDDFCRSESTSYDYCKPMESGHTVAGSDRWHGFEDEPTAARIGSEVGTQWVEDGIQYAQEHFVEGFYGFLQKTMQRLDDAEEHGVADLHEMVDFVATTYDEMNWSEGGEEMMDRYGEVLTEIWAEADMARYEAGRMRSDNPMECHVFDYYTYGHMTMVDGGHHVENVQDLLSEPPEDCWVVPLDTHL